MLAGVKVIPKAEVNPARDSNGSGESSDETGKGHRHRRKSSKRKEDSRRQRRSGKKKYSSDDDSEDDKLPRQRRRRDAKFDCESESGSEESEEDKKRREKRRKKKRDNSRDDGEEEEEDLIEKSEIARKEMGLDWMLKSAGITSNRDKKENVKEDTEQPKIEEKVIGSSKELNPYLKDNGIGYPDEATESKGSDHLLQSSLVGDGGASWRLKALKRAKEQAAREGRNLDEVAKERWGSLDQLVSSVATSRVAPSRAHLHAIKNRRSGQADDSHVFLEGSRERGKEEGNEGNRDYLRDVSVRHPEMRKPKDDRWAQRRRHLPNMSSEDKALISSAMSSLNKFANDGSFMDKFKSLPDDDHADAHDSGVKSNRDGHDEGGSSLNSKRSAESVLANKQPLNANQLAAKILQLRMKGKHEEAEQLSKEMDALRAGEDVGRDTSSHEVQASTLRKAAVHHSGRHKNRKDDADVHLAKTIVQNKQYNFAKSADEEYDFDGSPRKKGKKKSARTEDRGSHKQFSTQKERCLFCFENPSRPKHLVVALANFTYLMLPQWEPVVQGHCAILPLQHEPATRTVDENIWTEIRNFKKCLLKMFAKENKSVLFMETVIDLSRQRRHCIIECIPIPYELSEAAPMYFKKAIDEAEDEWGQHEMKKLIPTSGNLRNVIPENFAYFHVEFGLDRGFVHVIDDESNFSSGFGLNVVRGMLQLPEEDMHRRRRYETIDKQKQAVAAFQHDWEPFDWTRQLD